MSRKKRQGRCCIINNTDDEIDCILTVLRFFQENWYTVFAKLFSLDLIVITGITFPPTVCDTIVSTSANSNLRTTYDFNSSFETE